MPTYEIQAPNGKKYRIDGPAGASDDDVRKAVLAQFPDAGQAESRSSGVTGSFEEPNSIRDLGRFVGGMAKGGAQAVGGTLMGVGQAITHPGETAQAVGHAVTHPYETGQKALTGVVDLGSRVLSGQPEALGEAIADVSMGGAGGAVARRGLSALRSLRPAEKIVGEAQGAGMRHHLRSSIKAGLPESDSIATEAGRDLHSTLQTVGQSVYDRLKSVRQIAGDYAFDTYRNVANTMEQAGTYFSLSKPGIQLIDRLSTIIKGGAGEATEFTKFMRDRAESLRNAISGIEEEASGTRKPANIDVIDTELRQIREAQHNKGVNGYSATQRQALKSLGDDLEKALKDWVGHDNYPRKLYAEMSDEFNRWNSKLGQALSKREKVKFVPDEEQRAAVKKGLDKRAFESTETVKELKTLIGEENAAQLAERQFSNEMRGKSAADAAKWVDKNHWIKEFPGLKEKAVKYVQYMAEHEGDAKTLKWVKKAAGFTAAGAAGAGGAYGAYKSLSP